MFWDGLLREIGFVFQIPITADKQHAKRLDCRFHGNDEGRFGTRCCQKLGSFFQIALTAAALVRSYLATSHVPALAQRRGRTTELVEMEQVSR